MYPKSIQNLIETLKYFPGVGEKSAERMAFSILGMEEEQTNALGNSIIEAKHNIKKCSVCNNYTESDICSICSDLNRNKDTLCVVEDCKTLYTIEKTNKYHGYYYILNGLIRSFDVQNIEELNLNNLIKRITRNEFKEVIIAVKPCIEGEMTALYIKNLLSNTGVKVTRLASGIPMGADMDYVDSLTLERAFDNRSIL